MDADKIGLVERLLKYCALRQNTVPAREAMEEAADLITAQAAQIEELVGALRLISDYAKKLRKGTNDWFDLVEIEAMATAALSRVKREGKR